MPRWMFGTHVYVWHDSRSYVWHDSFLRVTWLILTCDMTHSYVWHDSFVCVARLVTLQTLMQRNYMPRRLFVTKCVCVTWLVRMCGMTRSCVWHDLSLRTHVQRNCMPRRLFVIKWVCVASLVRMCGVTHSCEYMTCHSVDMHTSQLYAPSTRCVCVTWLIHMWVNCMCINYMRRRLDLYVWHDSFVCVVWLIHTCDMTDLAHTSMQCKGKPRYYSRRVFVYVYQLCHTHEWVVSYIWFPPIHTYTYTNSSYIRDAFLCVTWLIHMWDMTHSYVCTSPRWCTWLIYMCDMTHSFVFCETWVIRMCDITHSFVWHDSFICVT